MNSTAFRPLPDPEISLRDARDFILGSRLARRALSCSQAALPLFLQDLVEAIYRLVQSCHLPEFTDHGLPHICSLVDRISRWQLPSSDSHEEFLWQELQPDEAAMLLVATLLHDLGMLSQNPIDLPDDATHLKSKSLWSDVASWVRQTHVDRLQSLVPRIMKMADHDAFLKSDLFKSAVDIAKSHSHWPWDWEGEWTKNLRWRGLAAVVAVTDLLDEDAARCDTTTLLEHREGNQLNRAHWLRHALTSNRVLVQKGRIRVELVKPPKTGDLLKPAFSALRNHFRLVELYDTELKSLNARITNIDLLPSTGVPDHIEQSLAHWSKLRGFATENALCFQLLRTFMGPVLKDSRRCSPETLARLKKASLEDVDTSLLEACDGTAEPRTEYEKTFAAIAGLDE